MGERFASGKNAKAICDVCGFTCKYKELKNTRVKGRDTGIRACPDCYDPDHPQNFLGMYPVYDPQALRSPNSDRGELAAVRAQIIPVTHARAVGRVGQTTVSTT